MCTLTFLKEVLSGKKRLIKEISITSKPDIPRIKEINAKVIWNDIRHELKIQQYFPDIYLNTNRVPNRKYMFSVNLKDICFPLTRNLPKNA